MSDAFYWWAGLIGLLVFFLVPWEVWVITPLLKFIDWLDERWGG